MNKFSAPWINTYIINMLMIIILLIVLILLANSFNFCLTARQTENLKEFCCITYLLVDRWAGEASAFSAHIVPEIVQPVLEHVDGSRLDSMTLSLIHI